MNPSRRSTEAHDLPSAHVAGNAHVLFYGAIVFLGLGLWGAYRAFRLGTGVPGSALWPFFLFGFVMFVWQQWFAYHDKIKTGAVDNTNHVAILVPLFNEDHALFHQCLESMFNQSRKPNAIHVTDDGSNDPNIDYSDVKAWFLEQCALLGIHGTWVRTRNAGKRHAQVEGVKRSPEATIYATVDSDSILDEHAIREGLKPFHDPKVMSVAASVIALKNNANWLSRITDVLFVSQQQLSDRSALSAVGSVLVNSGGLAFYRADIIRENLGSYLNETFMGRDVVFSDDSLLTLYSLHRGKTVQQRSSIVFCAMPEDWPHHVKQQLRWMRGSFIRSFWRIRYLPVVSWGFARQVFGWLQLVISTTISVALFIIYPITSSRFSFELLLVPLAMSYGQGLRYFTVVRSDNTRLQQFANFLLIPLAWAYQFTGLRFMRFYAMATCARTGWNTRHQVEVYAQNAPVPVITQQVTEAQAD